MRVAVVGHVEWVTFARVDHVPSQGEIVHATTTWELPAGGGAAAAVQLAKLAGSASFFTALGDDDLGHRAHEKLSALGLHVHAVFRPTAMRRAFTHVDGGGERTITVLGDRLTPSGSDDLPWDELHGCDAVYVTAADETALKAARETRVVTATPRAGNVLKRGIPIDAVVGSALDASEAHFDEGMEPPPGLVVRTEGSHGGSFTRDQGPSARFDASELPGPIADRYGAGDAFAAGLTFGLGAGMPDADAIALAARCGAAVLTGFGPYEGQLTSAAL